MRSREKGQDKTRIQSIRITPEGVVAVLAAFSFLLLFRFIAGSDFRELALHRFQDDSYYYLQPAWQLAGKGFFTFDGINPTYGFQPLWMLVLSVQALFTPDKISFLRMAALLGAGFYCLAGFALCYLVRVWLPGWCAVIAPALWLVNPPLASLYLTGKENALYAFLLIAAAGLVAAAAGRAWTRRSAVVMGIVLGLMMLARVNAIIPAILLLAVLVLFEQGGGREKMSRLGWTLSGLLLMLIPWMLYAQAAFGTVFPNSGSAKLIGGWAAAAVAVHAWLPWIPAGAFTTLLPGIEKVLFAHPDVLTIPTVGLAVPFFLNTIPDLAIGFWKDEVLGQVLPYRAKLILLLFLALLVVGWLILQHPPLRRRMGRLTADGPSRTGAAVLAALLLAGVINAASNWLLLPAYLTWGLWYAVPETVSLLLMTATAVGLLAGFVIRWTTARWYNAVRLGVAAIFGLAVGLGIIHDWEDWSPAAYNPPTGDTQAAVYQGVLWMNDNLPQGVRVGSYSAGLLGYFANGYTVVNLDGLANTPGFVTNLLPDHFLFAHGLAADTPLRSYLGEKHIAYLANYDPLNRIQSRSFMGLVTETNSLLLYEGDQDLIWGPGEPVRRFAVVEIIP